MRVLRGFSSAVSTPTALTIGNFDGVHRGHVVLLERLVNTAREKGLLPAVLTFEPHPREFFMPDSAPARLTILREKLELIAACGIDTVMICAFNADFATLTAESFIERVLLKSLATKHLLIGDDFRFGKGRGGDFALLQDAGQKRGFTVEAMSAVIVEGERVSSSVVRKVLAAGDMERAIAFLGRPYIIDGRVIHGDKIGRRLGFNTANIHIRHFQLPMTGVFAVEVEGLENRMLRGVANLGIRPTRGGERPLLEVHLFDFDRFIYGAHLSVRFVHKLRDEQRFPDFDALKAQIARDAVAARNFFKF
ncbi:MAG: bifunctional riboflavin kinase/FAD synthetase [Proteobacteria bacterium]|nr:bifunctional riboflavin kinase/FAD synthetase [Pseudomonadota bacterium]